ncbi:hypothetical protein H7F51_13205 [Novosphingobium flavum]|uniref:Uncharacterized protein n=1 Tax=Novosphingobium flavum TaxID=1778672 RepID=A0A7X1KMC5_9SPHN|nr:hypothetical protein [Novosphingobium flavum]MBC2666479.1 hypothetical protein [Novosphingobium flavum]
MRALLASAAALALGSSSAWAQVPPSAPNTPPAPAPVIAGQWYHKGFEDPAGPPPAAVEQWLNTTCQPKSLAGIQMFSIQSGHGGRWNLHVWCHVDKAAGSHYSVKLLSFGKAKFSAPVNDLVRNPKVRIGPFFLGNPAEGDKPAGDDGVLVIEQTR